MDFFPLTLAHDTAFCNRTFELEQLHRNIKQRRVTLVVSPRRYGKTSLILKAIKKSKHAYTHFDFLSCVDESDIEKVILRGISQLLLRLERGPKKALSLATEFFSELNIKLSMSKIGMNLEVSHDQKKPAEKILDIIERIEKLAIRRNIQIVLFFDEFQRVFEISESHAIESVLRQVAQASKYLVFMFSGSNRHLLNKIFNDRNRPFYKMCERIILERISSEAYIPYIQSAAKKQWGKKLDISVVESVLNYTARHSYYVNLLCSRLWLLPSAPTLKAVTKTWEMFLLEERSQLGAELDLLSKNQRKLLTMLARFKGTQFPTSHEFQLKSKMSISSIKQGLEFLLKKDYIFQDELRRYCVLDPSIDAILGGELALQVV